MPPKSQSKADIVGQATIELANKIKHAQEHVGEDFPKVTKEEFQKMMPQAPKEFGRHWTEADEERLLRDWSQDPLKDRMLVSVNWKPMLWKTCVLFMRCLPTDIIGPGSNLEVDISDNNELRDLPGSPRDPRWPERFCHLLNELITHPMWQAKPKLLQLAIQYTVICCTNDCRRWRLMNPSGDSFITVLVETIKKYQKGETKPAEIHQNAIRRFRKQFPHGSPGLWSELFRMIEQAAKVRQVQDQTPGVILKVKTSDLRVLKVALDGMSFGQLSIFRPTDLISNVLQSARANSDVPSNKDLYKAHESVILHQLRKQRQEEILKKLQEQDEEEDEPVDESQELGSDDGLPPQSDPKDQDRVEADDDTSDEPRELDSDDGLPPQSDPKDQDEVEEERWLDRVQHPPPGGSDDDQLPYNNARPPATPHPKQGRKYMVTDDSDGLDDSGLEEIVSQTGIPRPAVRSKKDHVRSNNADEVETLLPPTMPKRKNKRSVTFENGRPRKRYRID
ncbi:hypothetical protein SLS53_009166 [Cytospora paraplurivora]|uniref:Uncharacterized protein n=1 Tax=Cytospora paraplurivora TaxID=2898453 RepID=A0AAN9TWC0_9PEZI